MHPLTTNSLVSICGKPSTSTLLLFLFFFPLVASLIEDESPTPVEKNGAEEEEGKETEEKEKASESVLEEELASVSVGDTSSMLESLDNEVSMMVS